MWPVVVVGLAVLLMLIASREMILLMTFDVELVVVI